MTRPRPSRPTLRPRWPMPATGRSPRPDRPSESMTATRIPRASELTIPVQGMTCAACSARVQRTLERTPGVSGANVNLMTGSATVAYDPASVTPERLVDAIRETGYGAELPGPDSMVEEMAGAEDAR